jgi:hypothetical protein
VTGQVGDSRGRSVATIPGERAPRVRHNRAPAAYADLVHVAALHSSMAFGFNLFLPFRAGADLAPSLAPAVGPLTVDAVVFEWVPPGAVLGEIDGDVPRDDEPATGVDVLVRGRREDGARVAILVEVKLSEGGFTPCGGRTSRANRRTDLCEDARAFLAAPSACYLTRPFRKQRDRRYWAIFEAAQGSVAAAFPGVAAGPCPFAGDAQPRARARPRAGRARRRGVGAPRPPRRQPRRAAPLGGLAGPPPADGERRALASVRARSNRP